MFRLQYTLYKYTFYEDKDKDNNKDDKQGDNGSDKKRATIITGEKDYYFFTGFFVYGLLVHRSRVEVISCMQDFIC